MLARILKAGYCAALGVAVLFGLTAGIGGLIPRNAGWDQPDPDREPTVAIMVASNGIHTEIVMPLMSEHKDWSKTFPSEDLAAPGRPYTHIAVSWGERVFFLETARWVDLKPMTAISALTGGDGIIHVAHYVRPTTHNNLRVLHLRASEYRALATQIEQQLVADHTATRLDGYGSNDVFYDAIGTYHLGNTCNQWTADQLAAAGVKIGAWAPLPGGVMQWVPRALSEPVQRSVYVAPRYPIAPNHG